MSKLIGAKGYRINEMIVGARNCLVKWGNLKLRSLFRHVTMPSAEHI